MTEPPVLVGVVHDTVAWVTPATAFTPVGALGTPGAGLTAVEDVDVIEVPLALVAVTVNV